MNLKEDGQGLAGQKMHTTITNKFSQKRDRVGMYGKTKTPRKATRHEKGRKCQFPNCTTILSIYTCGNVCLIHRDKLNAMDMTLRKYKSMKGDTNG